MRRITITKQSVATTVESEDGCRCSYCHSFATTILPHLTKGRFPVPKHRGRKQITDKRTGRGVVILPQTVFRGPFQERNHKSYDEIKSADIQGSCMQDFYFKVNDPRMRVKDMILPAYRGLSFTARRRRESTGSDSDHSMCSLESAGNGIPTAQQLVLTKLRNELDELQAANQQLVRQRLALFDTMDEHLAAARHRIRVRLHQEKTKRDTVNGLLKQHRKQVLHKRT